MKKTLFSLLCIFSSGLLMAQWTTSGANIYTTADKIGLGTSTPGERLDIKGHLLINTGTADGGRVIWRGGTGGAQEYRARIAPDGHLGFFPGEGNPTVFALTQNGNVGIGTSTPSTLLDVRQDQASPTIATVRNLSSNAGAVARYDLITSTANSYQISALHNNNGSPYFQFSVGTGVTAVYYDAPEFSFRNGSAATRLKITSNGNVGIGTTNPGSYKLAVEGKIGAREVKVTLDSWADYVFSEHYNLIDLKELEEYIKKNNHLPGIPSANEVKENGGIDLGEMNRKLLEKVEELTLYIIDQQKQLDEMKKKMQEHN